MPAERSPRRSALRLPGDSARALEAAATLAADVLILDLEDAVAPSAKEDARALVRRAGAAGGYGERETVIRINGLDTRWGAADLVAAAEAGPDAVLIPKVESAEQIAEADARLTYHDAPADTAIWAMIETPLGVLNAPAIAAAPRMACFVLGAAGLALDLRADSAPGAEPLATARALTLLAARARGLACIDGAHAALGDAEGLRAACLAARALGFDGKLLIDPAQIATANAAFGPSPEALAEARAVVAAHEAAQARGEGVAVLDARVLETAHVENARRLLAEAEMIAALQAPA